MHPEDMKYSEDIKYSIVEINSKQYLVEPGKVVMVDHIDAKEGDEIEIDKVLLYRDEKDIKIGRPYTKDIKIKAKVLGETKGKKIRVFKYKKRKDYRRTIGSRPLYTKLMIEDVK